MEKTASDAPVWMSADEAGAWADGWNAAMEVYRPLLQDAAYMFQNIEDARRLPPTAQAQQQYVALGKLIRDRLQTS
jgi:hypothetical protein